MGSVGEGLGTEAALGIEPVTSSLAGASLPPLVLFRIAKKPNTRIATTAIPCRVRRLGVSQGTAKRCCIIIFGWKPYVEAGGMMSYGPILRDNFARLAVFVDKIFKGAKPADLPVEQPTKFEMVINLKTAKALGLEVPWFLQQRADEVIE